jgi:hypothetical protein
MSFPVSSAVKSNMATDVNSEEGAVTYKLRKFTDSDEVNIILDSIPETCKSITKTERALEDLRGNVLFFFCIFVLYQLA